MCVFKQTTLLLFCISMTSELLLALWNWFFVLELVTFEIIQECTLKILSWFSQENFIFSLLSLYLPPLKVIGKIQFIHLVSFHHQSWYLYIPILWLKGIWFIEKLKHQMHDSYSNLPEYVMLDVLWSNRDDQTFLCFW